MESAFKITITLLILFLNPGSSTLSIPTPTPKVSVQLKEELQYKYYSNKKGTQVIELGPGNACQVFQGEDARFLREVEKQRMTNLNYIQFRLLVGKCQLDAFLNNQSVQEPSSNLTKTEGAKSPLDANLPINTGKVITSKVEENTLNGTLPREPFEPSGNATTRATTTTTSTTSSPPTEAPSFPFIFPGTKWCGAGTRAINDDDIGFYVETDKCCRAHDKCPENMEGKSCKHGLCNDSEFTRSHCECDDEFRVCLQKDRSLSALASFKIANLYFNILKPLCYTEKPPVRSCTRHRITGECIDFEFDPDYHPEWQFFPAQPYLSEFAEKLIHRNLPKLPSIPFLSASTTAKPEDEYDEDDHELDLIK